MRGCRASGRKQGERHPLDDAVRDFLAGLIIFITVFALAALDAGPARPQPAAGSAARTAGQQAHALTPARMRSGALLIRPAKPGASGCSEALLVDTDVAITVDGTVARAVVTQTFRNTGDETAEGVYVFPLPGDAAVDTLAMQIGARTVNGEIIPRSTARAMYADAKLTATRSAADPPPASSANIVTSTVTSIPAGETVLVRIAYQQVLKRGEDGYRLRFPLSATPGMAGNPLALGVRYAVPAESANPAPARIKAARQETGQTADRGRTGPVALQVRLQAGFPLGGIESVNHAAAIERTGEDGALLRIRDEALPADKDFVLKWRPRDGSEPTAQIFRQQFGTAEYVLAMLTPPSRPAAVRQPRDVIFVVDTSGSMAGSAILQMRQALDDAIARLDGNDRFNIIAFDSGYEMLFKTPVPADDKGKAIAAQFVDRLLASGATDLIRPLAAALKDDRPDDTSRVRQVVVITDGAFKSEQKLFSEIAVRRGRTRLFLVGIGPVPQASMLRRAAEVGRGSHLHIASTHDIRTELDAFLTRLERPAITDIRVAWPKGVRAETLPDPIPDVYAGAPLVFTARSETALKGKMTLTGTFGGKPWRKEIGIEAASEGHGIARVWARRKIASLESHGYYARQNGGDVSAQIEKVALEHRLVSRMTRLVAFETPAASGTPQRPALADGNAPPARPHGLVHSGAIDAAQERPRKRDGHAVARDRPAPRMVIAPRIADNAPPASVAAATAQEADQPAPPDLTDLAGKTAQLAQAGRDAPTPITAGQAARHEPFFTARMGVIAVMALIFAAMSALTLGLWRQFGRLHAADEEDNRRGK